MIYFDGEENWEYELDCRDFSWMGKKCCSICHEFPDTNLRTKQIDGKSCLVCCVFDEHFFPAHNRSPEEKLLRAIFGEAPHEQSD